MQHSEWATPTQEEVRELEYTQLEEWGKKYLMRELKLRAAYAEKEMMWFSVTWGLKYSDFDEHIKSKLK